MLFPQLLGGSPLLTQILLGITVGLSKTISSLILQPKLLLSSLMRLPVLLGQLLLSTELVQRLVVLLAQLPLLLSLGAPPLLQVAQLLHIPRLLALQVTQLALEELKLNVAVIFQQLPVIIVGTLQALNIPPPVPLQSLTFLFLLCLLCSHSLPHLLLLSSQLLRQVGLLLSHLSSELFQVLLQGILVLPTQVPLCGSSSLPPSLLLSFLHSPFLRSNCPLCLLTLGRQLVVEGGLLQGHLLAGSLQTLLELTLHLLAHGGFSSSRSLLPGSFLGFLQGSLMLPGGLLSFLAPQPQLELQLGSLQLPALPLRLQGILRIPQVTPHMQLVHASRLLLLLEL